MRKKIIEAIVKVSQADQEYALRETLLWISDLNLLALAKELGVDTDTVLS